MPDRRLPVRPTLETLEQEAADLLWALHAGAEPALAEWREWNGAADAIAATLADARHLLARSYRAADWPHLERSVNIADAIWRDDAPRVMQILDEDPALLHQRVLIREDSSWGPPMSYAANLGRDTIIRELAARGATDFARAADRAALQGQIATLHLLYDLAGRPSLDPGMLAGPAYTLNVPGTMALLALGVRPVGPVGLIPVVMEHLLGTDSRNPEAKHRILELYAEYGVALPDTPIMALHRGRTDLLERHMVHDPALLTRTFTKAEVFAGAPACVEEPATAQGTPVHGVTLLHLAAYFDEVDIGAWLLDRGASPDVPAAVDAEGFGGYTALFSTVVSQRNFWVNFGKGEPDEARLTRLLLDRGANPNARASIRARREEGHGGGPVREFRDVTPLAWGEQYHDAIFVSRESMRLLTERGGQR